MPFVVVAVILVLTGVYFNSSLKSQNTSLNSTPTPTVSSPTTLPSATPIPPLLPTSKPIITTKPTHTPPLSQNLYQYPGSLDLGSGKYTSSDEPDKITEWYKLKINSDGFNVKSFIKTNSNNKILNKLSGAKNNQNISIEITREPNTNVVNITVSIDNG
jgi:hypothetical protein